MFVSDGGQRRVNIFDCSPTSNREFLPDPSHCTKIATASLQMARLPRKDVVDHLQLHMQIHGVGSWVRNLKSILYTNSEVCVGENIALMHSSPS